MATMKRVSLLFILTAAGSLTLSNAVPPRITSHIESEIVIKAGDVLNLRCESKTNATWSYSVHTNAEVKVTYEKTYSDFPYVVHLRMTKADYLATGYFNCSTQDIGEKDKASIYVYVKDESNPFVDEEIFLILVEMEHHQAVFPCQTTSPDVNVVLEKIDGDILEIGTNTNDGSTLSFDSKIGFILGPVNIKHSDIYICKASGSDMMKMFSLTVLVYTPSITKPVILDYIQSHIEVGDNVTLTCKVTVDPEVTFDIIWDLEHTRAYQENRTHVSKATKIDERTSVRNLTIYNIDCKDEGGYTCQVKDHAKNRNNQTKHIQVYDMLAPKTNKTNINSTDLYLSSAERLQLVCRDGNGRPKPAITSFKGLDFVLGHLLQMAPLTIFI